MTYLEMHWQTVVIFAAAVLTVVIVLCGVGWLLWWRLPKRQMRSITAADPKARADIEDNFRKTIGQLLAVGGAVLAPAAVLIAASLAYLQFTEEQRNSQEQFKAQQDASRALAAAQAETARKQLEAQQKAAGDLLISDQVSKGFEQFGNDNIRVRLGGIYALEGVMNNSKEYYQPVLEALCAFVRDGTKTATSDKEPTTDIQAALTVIGRRKAIGEGAPIDPDLRLARAPNLAAAHISEADLIDANLRLANLISTDLSRAILNGADLSDAFLSRANLTDADLNGAHLHLANLFSADLTGALLNGANLTDAALKDAILRQAKLIDADLSRADLSRADLSRANLTRADLRGADLRGATVSQAQLDQACGTDAELDPGLTIKPC